MSIGNIIVADNSSDIAFLTLTLKVLDIEDPQLEENLATAAPIKKSETWEEVIILGWGKIKVNEAAEGDMNDDGVKIKND